MAPVRKLLYVAFAALAVYGAAACATETELNPQPLPPSDPPARTGDESSQDDGKFGTGAGGSSGTSGGSPASAADAGADGADSATDAGGG